MKIILTLVAILITTISHSQITETAVSPLPTTIGSFNALMGSQGILIQRINNGDTSFTLSFKRQNPDKINFESIDFIQSGGTLTSLYNILNSFFAPENIKNQAYKKSFKLGQNDITCTSFRSGGFTSIVFSTKDDFFVMTEKQLHKLFGK